MESAGTTYKGRWPSIDRRWAAKADRDWKPEPAPQPNLVRALLDACAPDGSLDESTGRRDRTRVHEDAGSAVIARNVTHDVCSHCGGIAGAGAHGHTDAPDWRWLRVEYAPADQLQGAVSERDELRRDLQDAGRGFDALSRQLARAVDVEAATDRVMALMVREYGAAASEETREQAVQLARAAIGGQ